MTDSYSILIIEDEKNILDFMARTLRSNGYKTLTSETGQSGLSIINSQYPDLTFWILASRIWMAMTSFHPSGNGQAVDHRYLCKSRRTG